MKRCPTCNRAFIDDMLSFCTEDGTALVKAEASSAGQPPTVVSSPSETSAGADAQATWVKQFDVGPGTELPTPHPAPAPRKPPPYPSSPQQSLAIVSMIAGIIGAILGWVCFGPVLGIVAIILGIVALSQIKQSPERFGGKTFAWIGIAGGGVSLLIQLAIIVVYAIFAALAASSK